MMKPKDSIISDKNSWCFTEADSLEVLIDAKDYYEEFFKACRSAEEQIILAGWVMEDRLLLSKHDQELPDSLAEFFKSLCIKRPKLSIHTMVWSPGFYLDFGRQPFKKSRWSTSLPANFHHKRDKSPFLFGSRHEKYALIDQKILFVGGMDVTSGRYDTRDHAAQFQKRRLPGGKKYRPRHDVQLKIQGAINHKVLELPKKRTGERLKAPAGSRSNVSSSDKGTRVYFSRTEPSAGTYEIEKLYLSAIKKARDWIYIENQYYTNQKVHKAIVEKLKEESPPQIVIVLPRNYGGVFEKAIFGRKRDALIRELKRCDKKNKLRVLYPSVPGESRDSFVVVHSKLMAVDGKFFTIGSANLNERSMRVDTELNASIEGGSRVEKFTHKCVADLLAEHLEERPESIEKDLIEKGPLPTIEARQKTSGRTLKKIEKGSFKFLDRLVFLIAYFIDIKRGIPKHVKI